MLLIKLWNNLADRLFPCSEDDKVALKNADGSFLFFAQLFSHFRPFFSRPLHRQIRQNLIAIPFLLSIRDAALSLREILEKNVLSLVKSNDQNRAHLQQKSWDRNVLEFVN